eukprot:TRINITY_DN9137_c0_g2_i2.p1 TRINITY_DN9137_c0_g2~~TRINITY_DN9137_c0_g2_i2.p1  ORF type:complete len:324 (-),score=48.88 TRINITY_DN9137_c0_g2_i2:5-976(-)
MLIVDRYATDVKDIMSGPANITVEQIIKLLRGNETYDSVFSSYEEAIDAEFDRQIKVAVTTIETQRKRSKRKIQKLLQASAELRSEMKHLFSSAAMQNLVQHAKEKSLQEIGIELMNISQNETNYLFHLHKNSTCQEDVEQEINILQRISNFSKIQSALTSIYLAFPEASGVFKLCGTGTTTFAELPFKAMFHVESDNYVCLGVTEHKDKIGSQHSIESCICHKIAVYLNSAKGILYKNNSISVLKQMTNVPSQFTLTIEVNEQKTCTFMMDGKHIFEHQLSQSFFFAPSFYVEIGPNPTPSKSQGLFQPVRKDPKIRLISVE